ncbi:transketolase [Sorangium cellulosum]|uniref:Transketolase n=1 Tax=Sorangium cellulosum TaxID=56 RepID=A0A2L0EVS8_SORCE|nr:transketolase [Sorangium cellulosum]AUX43407.1 transketolase [Sorangium cellulosum]
MPDFAKLAAACTMARGLAMDAVHACSSGHLGLPLGAAEIGAVLYGDLLRHDPSEPHWLNRDRFVLSAGHGSMFLYGWLHLAGYPVSIDDIRRFRQWESKTPGHPEYHYTEGVEATTGPLGQGVGNAVGHAVAAKMLAARYNTKEHTIFDLTVYCLAGDGCLQEGVAAEAASFAGHFKLDNLVLIYDANDVTLDAMAAKTQSEDTGKRFEAYGFEVLRVEQGNDLEAVHKVLSQARASKSGKPKFVIAHTLIGKGIPEVAGTQKAHGEGGAKFVDAARKNLGLPPEHFYVSEEVKQFFAGRREVLGKARAAWEATFAAWREKNPELAQQLDDALAKKVPADLDARVPAFAAGTKVATRKAGETVLQAVAGAVPSLIGASADLYGSTFNYIASSTDFDPEHLAGRNIRAGIREHGMGAIMNGIAYHGGVRPSGATFLVFADYLRPSIRLAALSHLPVIYIFTHDSVGVGEDGPTHQPVETVAGLRAIVDLDVIRPADAEETAGAWIAALERTDHPTVLALTRQAVPLLPGDAATKREGVRRGAYILVKETAALETILIATGSEVQHAVEAAKKLGAGVRVVSMPCVERFARQDRTYREAVLPAACTRRVSIEAGVTFGWHQWVGSKGLALGIDRYGTSAPGDIVLDRLGMNAQAVIQAVQDLVP